MDGRQRGVRMNQTYMYIISFLLNKNKIKNMKKIRKQSDKYKKNVDHERLLMLDNQWMASICQHGSWRTSVTDNIIESSLVISNVR